MKAGETHTSLYYQLSSLQLLPSFGCFGVLKLSLCHRLVDRYGTFNEKKYVYSFGVVLLELITGKEAIQTNQENRQSLGNGTDSQGIEQFCAELTCMQARSLLVCGVCECLIDPYLHEDYNKEMELIMVAARLCLLDTSSRRPTMKWYFYFTEKGILYTPELSKLKHYA